MVCRPNLLMSVSRYAPRVSFSGSSQWIINPDPTGQESVHVKTLLTDRKSVGRQPCVKGLSSGMGSPLAVGQGADISSLFAESLSRMLREVALRPRALRILCPVLCIGLFLGAATSAGGQTTATLKERMAEIQKELDAATARLETLRTEEDNLNVRLEQLNARIEDIERRDRGLERRVIRSARALYMGGSSGVVEALLTARSVSDLTDELQYVSQVSETNSAVFVRYAQTLEELNALRAEERERVAELGRVATSLSSQTASLQRQFHDARDEYERLVAQAQREAQPTESAPVAQRISSVVAAPRNGLVCPVAGPNSFIDSWGYPRSGGRTHEGTDIMAASGTPVVAITDGTITYEGYGSSAGYWIILTGDDGHGYWYMHNTENLVSGGRVQAGQQIATVGSTGNASGGAPHVHFEYHPGGGGPVNPYSMLAGIC